MSAAEAMTNENTTGGGAGKRGSGRGLGRGLDALFGDADPTAGSTAEIPQAAGTGGAAKADSTLPVELIHPGMAQPRKHFDEGQIDALAQSMRENGVLQPLIVRPHPTLDGQYEIVAGERRWRAAQKAEIDAVPAIVREISDETALEVALIENLQREDLNALEEAEGYRRLSEQFSYTQEALSKRLGKSRSHVANVMRLLSLPDGVKRMVTDGRLSAGHARALLNAPEPEALAKDVVARGLNVRQTEKLATTRKTPKSEDAPSVGRPPKTPDTADLERQLSNSLGLKVTIAENGEKGAVTIAYETLEQLDDLLQRLC